MAKKEKLKHLTQQELIAIIQACDKEIQRLNGLVSDREKEIDHLNGLIDKLAKANVLLQEKVKQEEPLPETYNEKWKWVKKVVYVVRHYNRPVLSFEILEFLLKHDTIAQYWKDKTKYLSIQINKALKYEKLMAHKVPGVRGYYYVLPEWFSEDGELLSAYTSKIKKIF